MIQKLFPLLFETEVEEYLQHLEARLKNSNKSGLRAELVMMATELGGLGEMLQLTDLPNYVNQLVIT